MFWVRIRINCAHCWGAGILDRMERDGEGEGRLVSLGMQEIEERRRVINAECLANVQKANDHAVRYVQDFYR